MTQSHSKTIYPEAHSFTFLSDGSDPGSKMPLGRCWIRPIRCAMRTCSSSVSWQARRLSPGLGWYTGSGCVSSWKKSNRRWGASSLKYATLSTLKTPEVTCSKIPGVCSTSAPEAHQVGRWWFPRQAAPLGLVQQRQVIRTLWKQTVPH